MLPIFFNNNSDIKSSAHDAFLEQRLSGTLEEKLFESHIVLKYLGGRKSKSLNRIGRIRTSVLI